MISVITETLAKGERVQLLALVHLKSGIGLRKGRNPQTRERSSYLPPRLLYSRLERLLKTLYTIC